MGEDEPESRGTGCAGGKVSEVEPTGLADWMWFVKEEKEMKMTSGFWVMGRTVGLLNGWGVETREAGL